MNVNAIVLKEISVKEEDKIVVVFSKEYGKMSLYAKEGRKTKSPFLAGSQLLTYSNFYIHKKDNLSSIKRIEIKDSFYDLKNDIDKLYLAMYFAEFTDALIIEESPSKEMFNFLLYMLEQLKTSKNLKLMKVVFEIKMMSLAGFTPNVEYCTECGSAIKKEDYDSTCYVESNEGIVCSSCNTKSRGIKLSSVGVYTIKYIIYKEKEKLCSFGIDSVYIEEISKVATSLKNHVLEKELKTEKFI